jgi:type I restriction enzyme S subunit
MSTALDWPSEKFADVLEIRNGRNQREVENATGPYPIYGSGGVMGYASDYICEANTTIIGRKGSINNPLYVKERFWTVDTAFGLHPKERLHPRFLYYYCLYYDFSKHNRGTTIPSLVKTELLEIRMPLPPLPEQQRIVGKLDAAFAALTEAQAHVERNRANARELFESAARTAISNEVSNEQKYPLQALLDRRWIIDHMDGNHGGDYPKKEEFIDSGVPYISANCIRNEEVDFSLAKFLSPARASKLRKGFAKNQDVLFAHNATVGPVAMLRTNEPKVILGTSLTYYRCDPEYVIPEYLAHYLRSRWFREQYESVMQQSTRNQVPITKQREFTLIIPSAKKQKQIVLALDGLLSDTRQLETTYQQKLTELAGLKKAVLGAAFRGEL